MLIHLLKVILLTVFIFGCDGGDSDKKEQGRTVPASNIFSNIRYYTMAEIPPMSCRQEAAAKALWAEDFGYKDPLIVFGRLAGVNHVEAKARDMDGYYKWIRRTGNDVELVDSIPFFEPTGLSWRLIPFITRCYEWAETNNFYRVEANHSQTK